MNPASILETTSPNLPDKAILSGIFTNPVTYLPIDLDFESIGQFLLFFVLGTLILSILGRVALGKRSSLNHSVSVVMAILFLYAATIGIYSVFPWDPNTSLSPLPFVTFFNDYLVVLPIVGIRPAILCQEALSLLFLVFLMNVLDIALPRGNSLISWFILRFVTLSMAMAGHILLHWIFKTFFPALMVTYAPAVLLSILILMLTMGFLNAIMGLVLTISNPIVGGIYAFFFSNRIGKQMTKAVFTTAILCVILHLCGQFGYSFINISPASLSACMPLVVVCLILWYLTGHIL